MSSLVDTDLLIDGLHTSATAMELLEQLAPSGLAVSTISLGELFEGAYLSSEPDRHLADLRVFLEGYRVLFLDERIMHRFSRERASLRRRGLLIPDVDLLIADTALEHDLTLVTRNRRHFERIRWLKISP